VNKSRLAWRQLEITEPLEPSAVRACLVGLAALPHQPRLVLEAVARGGLVAWRIGAGDDVTLRKACFVVTTHLPGIRVVAIRSSGSAFTGADDLTTAAQLRISRSRYLSLGDRDTDSVTRALLAALAQAGSHETLRFQLLLGVRTWPKAAPQRDEARPAALTNRADQHGFGCTIRIAAGTGSDARAAQLVRQVGAAFRGLEITGVQISLGRIGVRSVISVSSPFCWPLWLSCDDLVPICGWPVSNDTDTELPGMPPRHPKLLPALSAHPRSGVVVGDSTSSLARGVRRPVAQSVTDAMQHRHVLGPTGVGKSTLLARLILQDLDAGHGVVVIDPKTDLVNDVLARIPAHRAADVVVLDPADPKPVGINPLPTASDGSDPDLAADSIVAVFHSLFGTGLGPRSTDILHASILSLARRSASSDDSMGSSLVMVPTLLTSPSFRRSVIGQVSKADPLGLGAFWTGFEALSDADREHSIRPLLNKLRQVLLRPSLRAVFGQSAPNFGLKEVFSKKKILLVKLGKDSIGQEAAALLGSLLVSHLWQVALSRIAVPAARRDPVMVYIDEVQDYLRLPGSLADALAQARGLGVGLTLAHQHRGQLSGLLEDVEANTGSKLFFRLSAKDARDVASSYGDGILTREDFLALPSFAAYAQLLVDNTKTPWVSITTRPLAEPVRSPAQLQARSAVRYGVDRQTVEAELLALTEPRSASPRVARAASGGIQSQSSRPAGMGRGRPSTAPQPVDGSVGQEASDDDQ